MRRPGRQRVGDGGRFRGAGVAPEEPRQGEAAEAALALATDPLGPLPPGMEAAELAAWTAVANVLLNLDGVLTKG